MRKRHIVVVSSSDDEDGDYLGNSTSSSFRSKLVTSAHRKKCRGSKEFDSNTRLCKNSHKAGEAKLDTSFEDFCKDLHELSVIPAERKRKHASDAGQRNIGQLWVNKYKPRSLGDLAVHKKKIEEVKVWLEERLGISKDVFNNQTLLITGQAGVGKSTTVHVIASQLGAELCEWKTPTPTLWQEHMHNACSGLSYMSKLDEFETFIERVRNYSLLPLVSTGGSKKSIILLIDDLPLTNGRVAYGRLSRCLHLLVQSIRIPTVILITENRNVDAGDNLSYLEELQSSLERAGASKVAFNPLTTNSIKKNLSRICMEEHCNITSDCVDQIAKSSGGDIRHAITSLQYFCLRSDLTLSLPSSTLSMTFSKGKEDEVNALPFSNIGNNMDMDVEFLLPFGRDETLSLFHALGKFLHNKRDTADAKNSGQGLFLLQERFVRFPLKMDAPEKVLSQAHGQTRPIADFLHENVLDFLSDEAIDDAWTVASYLSDTDCLLATSQHGLTSRPTIGKYDHPENVAQLVAASIAVRGVLFGNSHPSPPRWHSIRRPKLWQVEQLYRHNKISWVLPPSIVAFIMEPSPTHLKSIGQKLWRWTIKSIIWQLWKERNKRIFKGKDCNASSIWHKAWFQTAEWAAASSLIPAYSVHMIMEKWSEIVLLGIRAPAALKPSQIPLLHAYYNLNFYGRSFGNPGLARYGGPVKDHNGSTLIDYYGPLQNQSAAYAEIWALFEGVKLVSSLNF